MCFVKTKSTKWFFQFSCISFDNNITKINKNFLHFCEDECSSNKTFPSQNFTQPIIFGQVRAEIFFTAIKCLIFIILAMHKFHHYETKKWHESNFLTHIYGLWHVILCLWQSITDLSDILESSGSNISVSAPDFISFALASKCFWQVVKCSFVTLL